jgi:hypothetical protein
MKKEDGSPGEKTSPAAPDADNAKKTYEKAELAIHGDLKEITGGKS